MMLLALISGGKDSIYSIMCALKEGHSIVLLGHMRPKSGDKDIHELDSYMYQTVGHHMVPAISECLGISLLESEIRGMPVATSDLVYTPEENDEVEDLYRMVKKAKDECGIEGVLSGAIWSQYQYERIANICQRLKLTAVQPLWRRRQREILKEMIDNEINALVIKTCSMGLNSKHLGKSIKELHPHLLQLEEAFGFNVCGEGGEYESIVVDCPLYKKRIAIIEHKIVEHTNDPYAPTLLYVPTRWQLVDKE